MQFYIYIYIILKWAWVTSLTQCQPLFCLVYESQQHVFKSIHCILPEVHNGRPFSVSVSPVCGPRFLLSTLLRGRGAEEQPTIVNWPTVHLACWHTISIITWAGCSSQPRLSTGRQNPRSFCGCVHMGTQVIDCGLCFYLTFDFITSDSGLQEWVIFFKLYSKEFIAIH